MAADMTHDDRNDSRGSCCMSFCQWPGPMGARYIYGAISLIGNVLAWVLRENPSIYFKWQRHSGCHEGDRDCLASEAVLMISLSNFLFSTIMYITTIYTMRVHDCRSSWHSGWWAVKIIMLFGCYIAPILMPNDFLQFYGKAAPVGAGMFLITTLISVIRYIARMTSKWCGPNFNNNRCLVNTISVIAYCVSMIWIATMANMYVGCYNIALIFTTLGLVYFMCIISFFTKVKGCYMEPLVMGLYISYLCWSAIQSEPESAGCYKKKDTGSSVNWITMISFIFGLGSVTVSAFSTGTDYKCLQFKNVVVLENDVPYGYGFFHFVFATSSMNYAMVFLGWDTHHVLRKWSLDVGWISSFVHIANEGLAVILFVVVVISRVLARFYGIHWLEQLLGNLLGTGGQQLANESNATELPRSSTDNRPPQEPSRSIDVVREWTDERTTTGNNGAPSAQGPPPIRDTEPVGSDHSDDDDTPLLITFFRWSMAVVLFVVEVISWVLARFFGIDWPQQLLGNMFGTGGQQLADESDATELPRSSTNNRAPQEPSRSIELVVRDDDDDRPPSSSSSTTTVGRPPVVLGRSDEPQEPPPEDVVGRQYGEITEHWLE